MANLGDLIVKIGADITDFQSKITSFEKKFNDVMSGLTSPTAIASAAVLAIGTASLNAALEFDAAADKIAIKTGAMGAKLEGLKESFSKVFGTMPSDANTVAEAMSTLNVKLGLTGEPLEKMTFNVTTLARLMKEDIGPMTENVTGAFIRWGVAASDQGEALETFRRAAVASHTSVTALTGDLSTFAPALKAAGLDLSSSISLLGSFKLANIDAGSVMPAVTKAITSMAKAGIDPAEGFPALIARIRDAKTETEAISVAGEEFGTKGGLKLVEAIRSGALQAGDFAIKMKDVSGTIASVAADADDFGERWKTTWNSIKSLITPIGLVIMEVLDFVVGGFQRLVEWASGAKNALVSLYDNIKGALPKTSWLAGILGSKAEAEGTDKAVKDLGTTIGSVTPKAVSASAAFQTTKERLAASKDAAQDLKDELQRLSDEMANDLSNQKYFAEKQKAIADAAKAAALAEKDMKEKMSALLDELQWGGPQLESTKTFMDGIARAATDGTTNIGSLSAAFGNLGMKSASDAQKVADEAAKARDAVLGSSVATDFEKQTAIYKALEAQVAAAKAAGTTIPEDQAALFERLRTQLDSNTGLPSITTKWSDLGANIKSSVGGAIDDMVAMLFDGDFSFGERMKGMFKDIGIAVVDMFIKPAKDAIATFISETITDLLSGKGLGGVLQNIKDIGSALAGAFGGGSSSAAGAATTAAGGATSAAGSVAGVGSTAASGTLGTVSAVTGIVTGIVSAVSGVIGNFQNARQENTLNAIEESTRYSKMYLGGRGNAGGYDNILGAISDGSGWPLWKYLNWEGPLCAGLELIRDALYQIKDGPLLGLPAKFDALLSQPRSTTLNLMIDGKVVAKAVATELAGELNLQAVPA